MNNKISFNQETHEYRLDDIPVPSVTHIISETIGHGWTATDWYLTRGRAIHRCAEFICQGKEFKFDERLTGYIAAIRKFFADTKAEIIKSELAVASIVFQYAGTLDLICKIGTRNVIIDWKHSIDKNRIPLQIGGYAVAARETIGMEYCFGAGVQIKESGTYQMTEIFPLAIPAREFLALRTCYRIKEKCKTLSTQKEKENV
jgi:hypothetical protein